jgi:hypothetical protein
VDWKSALREMRKRWGLCVYLLGKAAWTRKRRGKDSLFCTQLYHGPFFDLGRIGSCVALDTMDR